MPDEPQSLPFSPEAEWAFARHVADVEAGRGKEFEALCDEHPELAEELRGLKAQWEQVAGIVQHLLKEPTVASARPQASGAIGPGSGGQTATGDELVRQLAEHSPPASRYEQRGEFAHGGMGEIHKVWDRDLRRELAMKLIRSREDTQAPGSTLAVDELTLARFLDEAQVTGQLDHPGVVPVHELGLDAHGKVYFTMRLVKGKNLGEVLELLREGKDGWTRTRVLGVLLKVCEAMAYSHSKGVVHRDLKPSNVMVGRFGEVYVMDWGLARVIGRKDQHDLRIQKAVPTKTMRTARSERAAETPDSPIITMDGTVVGTPSYMPPEQAEGRVEELGPTADVYALGSILYELLTGRKPYVRAGSHPSPHTILAALLSGPPTRIEELTKDVPAELVAICERAMARDRAWRYADMSALAEDLSAFVEHRVVTAYRTGAVAELRKWVERNRGLAASIALAFVLLVAGLSASLVFKTRSDRNAVLAHENEEEAREQATIARANEERAKQNEEEARSEKERADREAEAATKKADEVLRLSAMQKLEDLKAEADRLWPAVPEKLSRYEDWLKRAGELVAELPDHERKLAELRAKSVPWTEEEQEKHRMEHPKLAELETTKRHVVYYQKLRAALGSEPARDLAPEEVGVELATLPTTANEVNGLTWDLIDPDREDWGGEAKGLVLARHAVELAAELSAAERAVIRDSLAWALFANGRFDEAVAEEEKALEESSADKKVQFEGYLSKLMERIEGEIDPGKEPERAQQVAELEQRIAELEAQISKRPEWIFAEAHDRWWHNQLERLVNGLQSFADEESGLFSDGTSPEHGWGLKKRLAFALTLRDGFADGHYAQAWSKAMTAIRAAYPGLALTPQFDLVPIGPDPDSGLWEFAHLATGEPPARGADRTLLLKEETGLVFVLLPGGTFQMGAQKDDPKGPNYDPQARNDESPVHMVLLSPFFLSKYEMTQGQWLRFTGRNPSYYKPPDNLVKSLMNPVEQVTWNMCMEVCERLGLSLPSEAQWEYAARAGTTSPWWTGNERDSLLRAANLADQAAKRAGAVWPNIQDWPELDDGYVVHAPVNQFRANAFGLHNVHGNVWEWCLDGSASYKRTGSRDPVAQPESSSLRIIRGGRYDLGANRARSAYRDVGTLDLAGRDLGCRPARRITP